MERLELGWLGIEGQSTTEKYIRLLEKFIQMTLNYCIHEQILHNHKYLILDFIVVIRFFESYNFHNTSKIDGNFDKDAFLKPM